MAQSGRIARAAVCCIACVGCLAGVSRKQASWLLHTQRPCLQGACVSLSLAMSVGYCC